MGRLRERLLRFSYKTLNYFTFDTIIMTMESQYYQTGRKRTMIRAIFILFTIILLDYTFQFWLAIARSIKVDLLNYLVLESKFVSFIIVSYIQSNALLLSGISTFFLHTLNIVEYTIFKFVRIYPYETNDLTYMCWLHRRYNFTLLDCIFNKYSKQIIQKLSRKVSVLMEFRAMPLLRKENHLQLLKVYKLTELLFLFS